MKYFFVIILVVLSSNFIFGQNKYDYVHFNKLLEVEGSDFVIATIENRGKLLETKAKYLLFINTIDGTAQQVDFPKDANILEIKQVKIDSLQINKILVYARTVDLNGKKGIEWDEPAQIIVISPDGKDKVQLTADDFFVRTWTINKTTGKIVVMGHYDSNNNHKYDKTDKNEILIFDLKTLNLTSKII
ncbi:MAG: hypothetical protein LBH32_08750 [Dysgonamonadaceae bacterium]|jgi:hypothetical protein|nr:hypothetical protein [Dysgonamonadaceae bacterium]